MTDEDPQQDLVDSAGMALALNIDEDEVEAVNLNERGGSITDTVIEIWSRERDSFRPLLSAEDGGDIRFISVLNDRLSQESRLKLD